ncbi:hypothetical protein [Campylobacter sp. MIT 97-5078]|nr:hypothetical protein [Campylobacter sp. MIT 97-5078]
MKSEVKFIKERKLWLLLLPYPPKPKEALPPKTYLATHHAHLAHYEKLH